MDTQCTPKKVIGIYPGTFDPVTKGHLHLIRRACKMVDHLIVAVAENAGKNPLFNLAEREGMLRTDIENMNNKCSTIEVKSFNSLLVHFARQEGATCIIRGLRAVSDFDYEFQMTGMNAKLAPDIETVFLMAADQWQFVSSSFVKEICALDGDVSQVVTPNVMAKMQEKFKKSK